MTGQRKADGTRMAFSLELPWKEKFILVLMTAAILTVRICRSQLVTMVTQETFAFTKLQYNVSIYENSVGKTYSLPETHMGISVTDPELTIRYRIIAGDEATFFKAEEHVVGDFCFLLIRTRTNSFDVLNRERQDKYYLTVRAVGRYNTGGTVNKPLEAMTTVLVRVLDRNDLKPLFYPTKYSIDINENTAVHTSVARVSASDADEGINGEIYYSFVTETDMFAIHPTSGVVSLTRPIVYSEQNFFEIDVIAEDRGAKLTGGGRATLSIATVSIRVVQVNIHAPHFTVEQIKTVPDEWPVGFVYAVITVRDRDTGQNGQLARVHIMHGDTFNQFKLIKTVADQFNLEVAQPLRRDVVPFYNLTIQAIDKGMPPKTAMTTVFVRMQDFDDSGPQFSQMYSVSAEETVPVLTPLLFVNASRDGEDNNKRKLVYEIVGGNQREMFGINANTGLIFTRAPLDHEQARQVVLDVRARDGRHLASQLFAETKVIVKIIDCNDNSPVFDIPERPVEIDENSPVGTQVYRIRATDRDSGENSIITYELVNSNPVPFDLDYSTGTLRTTELLDYEKDRRNYKLVVRASDGGLPFRRESEMVLNVRLRDVNDNAPVFERFKCQGYLSREAPIGTQLVVVSAIDFDSGNIVSYQITSGNTDGCFTLDVAMGQLKLICDLRPSIESSRSLGITASDGRNIAGPIHVNVTLVPNRFSHEVSNRDVSITCQDNHATESLHKMLQEVSSANQEATISDESVAAQEAPVNLHEPKFYPNLPEILRVQEDIAVGNSIARFGATDDDRQYNGLLFYVISSGNIDSCFAVETNTGDLKILAPLDRELRDSYTLNITVTDVGQPPKSANATVFISVEDVNDCAPRFMLKEYEASVREDVELGTTIVRVESSDDDIGRNAAVTYELVSSGHDFMIDATSGVVTSIKPLDRERVASYVLYVRASDSGSPKKLSSTAKVVVRVTDINDNAPMFLPPFYRIKVREDLPNRSVVATVNAQDPDLNDGGQVTYSFLSGTNDSFSIDSLTGVVRISKDLDYETQQIYNITALARDRGYPALSSDCQVVIEVVDVNENLYTPSFSQFVMEGSVKENLPVGSSVMMITSSDHDMALEDRTVVYSIRDGTGLGRFTIDNSGMIRTAEVLDRESTAFYWLVVYAQDRGAVPRSASIEVYILVEDVNDNIPQAEEPVYYPSVFEDSPPGEMVVHIRASDLDENPQQKISFRITSGDPFSFFDINETTGLITTSATGRKLNRERQAEHILEVTISDNGDPELTSKTRIVVSVGDLNDNAPRFTERMYRVHVLEHTRNVNKTLYRVIAYDMDSGPNGEITYSFTELTLKGAANDRFVINDTTGEIVTTGPIAAGETLELTVRAMDNGRPQRKTQAEMYLYVVAMPTTSTKNPEFLDPPRKVIVMENDPVGHLVWLVKGLQADGNRLWFNISDGNSGDNFAIDTEKGILLIARPLVWSVQNIYNLTVTMTDGISSASEWVEVVVHDVHQHRPEFQQNAYKAEVNEFSDEGTSIVTVLATDRDEGDKLSYTIYSATNENSLAHFAVHPDTGLITLKERIDREANTRHDLVVMVRDQGAPSKRNFVKVSILVTDHNDHAPQFLSPQFYGSVFETAAVGTSVVQVLAVDRDKGRNAEMKMSIISGNVGGMFDIDETLGIITVAKVLDRARQPTYSLLVKASDCGSPVLSSTVSVEIDVTVSNNSPPRFDQEVYSTQLEENKPPATHLVTVHAESRASVVYEITKSNCEGDITINPNSGVLSTLTSLDYEVTKFCNVTVEAMNMLGMRTRAHVFLHVIDENDNRPMFEQKVYQSNVSEATPIGSVILDNVKTPLVIRAQDNDTNLNALLKYRIVEEEAHRVFAIGESTGALTTRTALDRETLAQYTFHVQVHDTGSPQLEAEVPALVVMNILDVNDSPPIFLEKIYRVDLILPTYYGVRVVKVEAEDADTPPNALLRYAIVYGNLNDTFLIDESTGMITVRNETGIRPSYEMKISATDGKFTSYALIIVSSVNSLDSGLEFTHDEYFGEISENSSAIVNVAQIRVKRSLLGQHFTFRLVNPNGLFEVGATSGVLRTSGAPCDRELRPKYKMIVEVTEHGPVTRRARVVVNVAVTDVNDNEPLFVNQPYYAVVSVTAEAGTVVKQVTAIDRDVGANGRLVYSLVPDPETFDKFTINVTNGAILLRRRLDKADENHQYILRVEATDEGDPPLQASVIVPITVMNQATPIFNQTFYVTRIPENSPLHTAVITVEAKSPYGRKLIYSISKGDVYNEFAVDFNTGAITVAEVLDYERVTSYELTLRATDTFTGVYAEVPVTVELQDVNDNAPSFGSEHYTCTISEATSVGASILRVHALDQDKGLNAKVMYHVITSTNNNDSLYFDVDPDDGAVRTLLPLDHERKTELRFTVMATDSGLRSMNGTVEVIVLVTDMNDNQPHFNRDTYDCVITDQAQRGQFVTMVTATDADSTDRGNLRYAIIEGNTRKSFQIDARTGVISLSRLQPPNLDSVYTLNVSVSDGVYTSFSRARIVVQPSNKYAPEFAQDIYNVKVIEDVAVGSKIQTVSAMDRDQGNFGLVGYTINSELVKQVFRIDSNTGSIYTLKELDRELRAEYEIPVIGADQGGRTGFTTVRVLVQDVNDCTPQYIMQRYVANIVSTASTGTTVIKVSARDQDSLPNANLEYSIVSSNGTSLATDLFRIEEYTGTVRVASSLRDVENQTLHFFVTVSDRGTPVRFRTAPVQVFVMSTGHVAPRFERSSLALAIPENTPVGTVLKTVQIANNLTVTYSIIAGNEGTTNEPAKFAINDLGKISMIEPLDHENVSQYILTIQAQLDTVPPLVDYVEVNVEIMDVNDNAPVFESDSYSIKLAENSRVGTKVIQVKATDLDSETNAHITYHYAASTPLFGNIFAIDRRTGWITTLAQLDREKVANYTFDVLARDNGSPESLQDVTRVQIEIVDYNDEAPTFSQAVYRGAVNEDAWPGTVILSLVTYDLDLGQNAQVSYYVTQGDPLGQFSVRRTGEMYVNRALDREEQMSYTLTIAATDGAFVSTATVQLLILDANDNAPVCERPYYMVMKPENCAVGTFLLQAQAKDRDEIGTSNARIHYELEGEGSDRFKLEPDTGILRTLKELDRETTPSYELAVKGVDGGGLFCRSQVFITVGDVNDNVPAFTNQQYTVAVMEDASVNTLLTRISATDADLGMNRKVTYSLTGAGSEQFHVDRLSGIISVAKPLDRESRPQYNITLVASDQGSPSQSSVASLVVILLDVNDNPPSFVRRLYSVTVSENGLLGQSLLSVYAASLDVGINAEISYSIINGNDQNKFKIDADTGALYVFGLLDYEETREYFLTVQAEDKGTPPLSSTVNVAVNVTDVNDNPPIFPVTSYLAKVKEDMPLGSTIVQVQAVDEDSDENAKMDYMIVSGNQHSLFGIQTDTGLIFLTNKLDREKVDSHTIIIKATDRGSPSLSGTVPVTIQVLDVNDSPPRFDQANYTAILQVNESGVPRGPIFFELRDAGRTLTRFKMTDDDLDPNAGPFTFDIIGGNELHKFLLARDGSLIAVGHFTKSIKEAYELTIRAFDNGNPPLYSDVIVTIKVIDESAFPPEVHPLVIALNSYYDDFPGGIIGKVKATDQDMYDVLTYKLVSDNGNLFRVYESEGLIEATRGLDAGQYILNVSASDRKYTSYGEVRLNVRAITDQMVENAVTIRLGDLNPEDFIAAYQTKMYQALETEMGILPENVVIIGLKPAAKVTTSSRSKRNTQSNLDILFSAYNSKGVFIKKDKLKRKFLQSKDAFENAVGKPLLDVFHDVCSEDLCVEGKCLSLVLFDEKELVTIVTELGSFSSPKYTITHMCKCNEHYAGDRCEKPMNECAHQPCPAYQLCVPEETQGYRCRCPDGKAGAKCDQDADITKNCVDAECKEDLASSSATLNFKGKSYIHWNIIDPIERQLTLSLYVRTIQKNAVLIFAGKLDRFVLEMIDGLVQYRFDLGSGEGIAQVNYYINDGRWHSIKVMRNLNTAELVIDDKFTAQAFALGRSASMNVENNAVYFGAHVITLSYGSVNILQGYEGCMKDILINGARPPISSTNNVAVLQKLERVTMQCDDRLFDKGACSNSPCLNGGTCTTRGHDYVCICVAERYTGRRCEIDLDPCSTNPCLNGGACRNGYNEFFCQCKGRFSGKTCDYGYYCRPNPCMHGGECLEGRTEAVCSCTGYTGKYCEEDVNECLESPCQNGGKCVNLAGAYNCSCPPEARGKLCEEVNLSSVTSTGFNITFKEIIGIVGVLVILFVIVITSVCICRWRRRRHHARQDDSCAERILNSTQNDVKQHKLSNLDAATSKLNPQLVNLPPSPCPPIPARPQVYMPAGTDSVNNLSVNNFDMMRNYGSAADDLDSAHNPNFTRDYLQNINQNYHKPALGASAGAAPDDTINKAKWDYPNIVDLDNFKNADKKLKALNTPLENSSVSIPPSDIEYMDDGDYHWDTTDWAPNPEMTEISELPSREVPDAQSDASRSTNSNTTVHECLASRSTESSDSQNDSYQRLVQETENTPKKNYCVHPNSYLPDYSSNANSRSDILNTSYDDRLDVTELGHLSEFTGDELDDADDAVSVSLGDGLSRGGSLSEISNLCEIEDSEACLTEDELDDVPTTAQLLGRKS